MTLLIAVPTLSMVTDKWAMSLTQLHYPIGIQGTILFLRGEGTVGEKRNKAVQYALKNNFSHIFFLDDDVIIPPQTLRKFWVANQDVISGVYYTKSKYSMPLIFEKEGAGAWIDYPKDKPFEVFGHPMGCSLIKTEIFKKMTFPYFQTPDFNAPAQRGTEEFIFWKQCDKLGIKRIVDPEIQCGHIDKNDFDKDGNPAIYYVGVKKYKEVDE